MQNHVLSLANLDEIETVTFAGFEGSGLPSSITEHETDKINIKYFSMGCINRLKKLPRWCYIIYALLRIIIQCIQLIWFFAVTMPRPCVLIMQNPPSVPNLLCSIFARRSTLIIDWHNYGFTIMRVN